MYVVDFQINGLGSQQFEDDVTQRILVFKKFKQTLNSERCFVAKVWILKILLALVYVYWRLGRTIIKTSESILTITVALSLIVLLESYTQKLKRIFLSAFLFNFISTMLILCLMYISFSFPTFFVLLILPVC